MPLNISSGLSHGLSPPPLNVNCFSEDFVFRLEKPFLALGGGRLNFHAWLGHLHLQAMEKQVCSQTTALTQLLGEHRTHHDIPQSLPMHITRSVNILLHR